LSHEFKTRTGPWTIARLCWYSWPLTRCGALAAQHVCLIFLCTLLLSSSAVAQLRPPPPKTIPDSINLIGKDIESEFTA
jgi:hypothetical protein